MGDKYLDDFNIIYSEGEINY